MDKDRERIRHCIMESLRELLPDEKSETPMDDHTDPIGKLGLDSADGLDFACSLSQRLGYHIPDKLNPFVDDAKNRARKVGEIVDFVCNLVSVQQEA